MIYLLTIILGLIQAFTEFLPISSSAHLILARAVMDFEVVDGLTFDVGLHVGTLIAVIVYFYRDLVALMRGFFTSFATRDLKGDAHRRLAWYILAASIPAAVAGMFFETAIEIYFRRPEVIVVTLVVGGVLFLVFERVFKQVRDIEALSFGGSLLIGLAQACALIPGVSRSGITIVAGISQGLKRAEAARFSFLLGAPALFGAGLKKALDLTGQPVGGEDLAVLFIGMLVSAVAGWLVIRFLLRFLQNHRMDVFAYYRFVLAAVVGVYLLVLG